MFSTEQLVQDAGRRLADRGEGSLRLEVAGRRVLLRGATLREASTLIEAGAAVFDVRAAASNAGVRVEVDLLPSGDPTVWAVLTVHPGRGRNEPFEKATHQLGAREFISACERGAAAEGVSLRVAPMPLPEHFGLILRAKGDEPTAWLALGQAWAGIDRLSKRCGWIAYLRLRSRSAPPIQGTPWFTAQVEVWVLRRPRDVSTGTGTTQFQTDDWVGF